MRPLYLCSGMSDQVRGEVREQKLSVLFFSHNVVDLPEEIPGGCNADHSGDAASL